MDKLIEDYIVEALQDNHLEDILEELNVDPVDAFMVLYESGLIDINDILERKQS